MSHGGPSGSTADPGGWDRVGKILSAAAELDAEERDRFLDRRCEGDAALRGEIDALLRAHEGVGPLDRLSSEVMEPLVAPLRGGARPDPERYEVGREIGRGGMGVVYRCRDLELQRDVALKFLPPRPGPGDEARRRFLGEARAAARLDHPNICTIHEIGETPEGGLFIAMPLYEGETLDRRLVRGPLDWTEAVDVAAQAARGLERAHRAGIVHRDVKPGNLCMTAEGVVKILDFGIAKVADRATGNPGELLLGTAAYMSPEQAGGEAVDFRTDLWSLGAVLFEMLTGERLFSGGDPRAVAAAIRDGGPPPLGRLRGTAPAPVLRVAEALLARQPSARPPSAADVARRLVAAGEGHTPGGDEAGEPVRLAPEGERRQATVLALALDGYASLLERLGPGELDARIARLQAAVEEVVERHGGLVNDVAGDGITALFGIPLTREDDVQRAVASAAELLDLAELGPERPGEVALGFRAGIATGTVVAIPSAHGGYRLAGEPARAAARLAAEAGSGQLRLDEESRRTGRSRDRPFRQAGLTPFTGRKEELASLASRFERARRGEGSVATVVGEAGVGKSRLLHELRHRLGGGPPARVLHGHCHPRLGGGPYHPLVEVLLEILDRPARPSGDGAEGEVADAVRGLDPNLERFVPFYLHLLSIPGRRHPLPPRLRGEQLRAGMREALVAILIVACREAPTALLLEDWHWADEASSEVLKELARTVEAHPLFVVVTVRPGYGTEWGVARRGTVIHLASLAPEASAGMARSILGAAELPEDVAGALHDRSGGNPFFLEELCQSLREAGVLRFEGERVRLSGTPEDLHLPTTIQGVIRTRLDRLPLETREVVRSAAVLGRDFALPILERLGHERYALGRSLERLTSLGILQQVQVVPERRFRFKHVLTREVAYDTLLEHQRMALHGKAGRAIEELHPGRLAEAASRLAHHFSRAERWPEAVRYGLAWARRARELSEYGDSLQILEEVDGWVARLPAGEQRRELQVEAILEQEELCETLGLRGRQQELLDRVGGLLDAETDRRRLAEVYRRRGDVYTLLKRFDEAEEALDAALDLARETGDAVLQGAVLRSLGLTGWHQGRNDEALRHIDEALGIDRERGDADAMTADLNNKAKILKDRGDHAAALACLEQALELLEETPSDAKKSYTLHNMGNMYRALGELDRAIEALSEAEELAHRRHLPVQRAFHLTAIAHIHLSCERIEEAVRTYETSVDVARRARYAEGLAHSLRPLGELLAGLGREAEALPYLQEAARLFGRLGNPGAEAAVWRTTAETAERAGELRWAKDAWGRCAELAGVVGDRDGRVEALGGLGRVQRELEPDGAAARAPLEAALELAREARDRRREGGLLNSLGILEWRHGAWDRALERYGEALEVFRDLDDEVHAGLILNSLGVTLGKAGRTSPARARLLEGLELHRRTGERLLEGHALAALGDLALEAGRTDEARSRFAASLEIRRAIGDRRGEGWMHERLARVNSREGREGSVRACVDEARRAARETNDPELLRACEELPR
jgi:tetratricopeptide (TPR) repeat protein/class 3 adenylate cyclase